LINNPKDDKCALHFEDQTMYIKSKQAKISLSFKDKATGKANLKPCLEVTLPEHYFSEDHDVYMFLAGNAGPQIPNQHVIHNIRFYDTKHLHDSEGQDTEEEKRIFHGKPKDVMRQKILSSDTEYTIDSYNS